MSAVRVCRELVFDKLVYKNVPTKERDKRHFKNHSPASGSHTSIKVLLPPLGLGFEDITQP